MRATTSPFVYNDTPSTATEIVCIVIAGASVITAFRYAYWAVRALARII